MVSMRTAQLLSNQLFLGSSRGNRKRHTLRLRNRSVHLIDSAWGSRKYNSEFRCRACKFQGRPHDNRHSVFIPPLQQLRYNHALTDGFRSAHHVPGSCPARQLLSRRRKGFPLAINSQRPDPPTGAGVWRPSARPLRQNRKTDPCRPDFF